MRPMNLKLALTTAFAIAALAASCSGGTRSISGAGADSAYNGSGNLDSPAAAERHGCCAENGGACGCGGGKVQCCDGSFAANCACE